jgi:Uroporphyrinogen-III decarboxylase
MGDLKMSLDMRKFWEVNNQCLNLNETIPRVPVSIHLDGDWICDYLKLDNVKYYSDFEYQQEHRLQCSEITERELGYSILPDVDFGVVMDASVYGGKVHYESRATPTLQPAVTNPEEIDALVERIDQANLLEQGLVPSYLEWRSKIKDRFGIELHYGAGMKGCATMLGQICGITNFLTWIVTDPEPIHKLADCWLRTSKRYIKLIRKETNFPGQQTGFAFASDLAGMLSPSLYREFIMDGEKELYDLFAPGPGDKRYYHADYHMLHHLEAFSEMGVNQVNIDPYIDPAQILAKLPQAIVFGQIPPTKVLLYGTPEEVMACAKRDIEQAGPGKHLVLCTAGSINPGTSFENLRAMCQAVEEYGYIY